MAQEMDSQRLNRLAREGDDETVAGETQAGAGTAPGQAPSAGTGERSHSTSAPPTGRLDAERATWGGSDELPGSVPEGAPPHNVGGAQGDQPEDAIADFPVDQPTDRAGVRDRRQP